MSSTERPAPEIHTLISRTWNGVRVEINEDCGLARVDIGTLPSYDLVGTIERYVVPALTGCAAVEVIGENIAAVAYMAEELDKLIPRVEPWLHKSCDTRRGVA